MLGVKINKFDNSNGTVKSFNEIFPATKLNEDEYVDVEILSIVDTTIISGSVYTRNLKVGDKIIRHDFGESNFYNNEDFIAAENVRFKYLASDLDGNRLARGYSAKELADKLEVDVGVIKRRLINKVDENSNTDYMFNVQRQEL